jgi:hypothetical protein
LNCYYLIQSCPGRFEEHYYTESFSEEELILIETIKSFTQAIHLFALSR